MKPARQPVNIWAALGEPQSVVALLILYCAIHLLVRSVLSPNFTLDESEQMLFSQSLQWGYRFRHPPLITWLSWAVLNASDVSRAAFFLLKYVLMAAGLVFYFQAARIVIRDVKLAALATLALLTTFVMGYLPHVDLMHTVLLAAMLAAYLWADARVIATGKPRDYLWLGLITGLGVLSKYIFIVLPFALAIGVAMTPRFRARLRLTPLIGAALLAIVIVAPYAWWAITNEYSLFALAKTITKGAGPAFDPLGWLEGAGYLGVALIGFGVPAIVLFPVLYWRACWPLANGDDEDRAWLRTYEIAMIAGAAMMLGAVFFVGTESFKERWMHQVAMPFFIWFFLRVKLADIPDRANKIFAGAALVFAIAVIAARIVIYETHGGSCKTCREYWPMQAYARDFNLAGFERGTIVAPSYDLAGNLRYVFPTSRAVTPGYPLAVYGPATGRACLIVWEGPGALPAETAAYLKDEMGVTIGSNAVRGDVEAVLHTTKNRRDTMRYILLPFGSGACN